jgi:PKD repeat protein
MMRIDQILRIPLCCAILLLGTAVSCLKETVLRVVVDFDYTVEGDNNTTPLTISIENHTSGADTFEWTFEGGDPAQSSESNPGKITFTGPGEHRIVLTARNLQQQDSREIVVKVDSAVTAAFDCRVLVNDFAPAQVEIENLTTGASSYEWTFEGGEPSTSNLANPGIVLFREEGEHRISLKVSNGRELFTTERTVTLAPALLCDFTMTPAVFSEDMEAPLTAILKNTSRSSLSVLWQSPEGIIADKNAEETTIRFDRPGTYTVTLTADNLKERKISRQQITVAPSSGIFTIKDLYFGISQARNTIGCFYSARQGRVMRMNELTSAAAGASVEIGFFALNSSFNHCYFFSPDKAVESTFPAIPGAMATQVNNRSENDITEDSFEDITTAADMDTYDFTPYMISGPGDQGDAFSLDELPVFSFFVTEDGRRGIIMVKEAVSGGAESYAVADMKIEKGDL